MGKLTPEQALTLTKEILIPEVEEAIKELKNYRSPGFDGFTPEFLKSVSDLLGGDLLDVINGQASPHRK